ncbi:TRASH domain-containing protein [Paludisphaera borealis]|uniref:Uncharacterized protein n=1 Tax=Paludisphaera borealis TaxID=1387353 RepID=A0A1U7CMI0_9BACT|nr:TRASH domain-containing protein [Paludisphaera borealis]APW60127.1 hypothetical protein BSF38_01591 [Paludisphaera borealis]
MKTRHRLFPSALALSFLIGCAGEEAAAPSASTPSSTPTASKPSAPPVKADDKAPTLTPAPAKDEDKDKTPTLTPAPAPTPPADEPKKTEAKPSLEGPKAEAVKLTEEEVASIKELPADDQAVALAQAVCPVSDEHLGAMGAPIKVSAEGRTFYICCKGCQKDVKDDAKAVVAKLDKLSKK